jgi:Mitochondrial carrier protein.
MLHGVGVGNAAGQLSSEGFYYLYRGILPPLLQKTLSLSIMFGVYEECRRPLENANVPHYLSKTISSMVAGTIEATLMPLERVQTLLQDKHYHSNFKNMIHAFKVIGANYGFKEYYRGLVPILLRNGPSNVFFFFLRDEANYHLPHHESWWGQVSQQFVSGAVIGGFISTIFYPLNVVKVHVQSTLGGEFQKFTSAFAELYKTRGLRNMYRGVHMNYTRSFISWGVINAAYEFIKKYVF